MKRFQTLPAALAALAVLAGCASQASKPAETLDERTGMTVGDLGKPLELAQGGPNSPAPGKRSSFAYLGPIEWDRMGSVSYGLWVHLAPANDHRFADIQSPGAVSLVLDEGATVLTRIDPPQLAHAPYRPVASWGQTAYFGCSVALLKRMAASHTLALSFKTVADPPVEFLADDGAHRALAGYLHARGY